MHWPLNGSKALETVDVGKREASAEAGSRGETNERDAVESGLRLNA
jgi:hypothetical protein